jgi:isochorismate pyruvate lyase
VNISGKWRSVEQIVEILYTSGRGRDDDFSACLPRPEMAVAANLTSLPCRAAELKDTPADAHVGWRVEEVATRVRDRALQSGLDPDAAEKIWRGMMDVCVDFERRVIAARQAGANVGSGALPGYADPCQIAL